MAIQITFMNFVTAQLSDYKPCSMNPTCLISTGTGKNSIIAADSAPQKGLINQ
jgi:hypothetical protein